VNSEHVLSFALIVINGEIHILYEEVFFLKLMYFFIRNKLKKCAHKLQHRIIRQSMQS
jgi:hypothetical protein